MNYVRYFPVKQKKKKKKKGGGLDPLICWKQIMHKIERKKKSHEKKQQQQ